MARRIFEIRSAWIPLFVLFLCGVSRAQPDAGTASAGDLVALIGKTCTFSFKNGQEVQGKVWDLDGDALIVKVRDGLVETKSQRFLLTDIDKITTDSGVTVETDLHRNPLRQGQDILIFSPGKRFSKNEISPDDTSRIKDEEQDIERFLTVLNEMEVSEKGRAAPGKKSTVGDARKASGNSGSGENGNILEIPQPASHAVKASGETADKAKHLETKPSFKAKTPKRRPVRRSRRRFLRKARPAYAEVGRKAKNQESAASLRVKILFATLGLILILYLFSRFLGIVSCVFGKYVLFPVNLLEMNEHYGVIDQGEVHDVRRNDVVRFYNNTDGKAQFLARVRVIQVSESCAAVELERQKSGVTLEAGAVGFRERSFGLVVWRRLRLLLSRGLKRLAGLLLYTAGTIDSVVDADGGPLPSAAARTTDDGSDEPNEENPPRIHIVDERRLKRQKSRKPSKE